IEFSNKHTGARSQSGQGSLASGLDAAHDNPFAGLRDNLKKTILEMAKQKNLNQAALDILKIKGFSSALMENLSHLDEMSHADCESAIRDLSREMSYRWKENTLIYGSSISNILRASTTCIPFRANRKIDKISAIASQDAVCKLFQDCSKPDASLTPAQLVQKYSQINHQILIRLLSSLLMEQHALWQLEKLHQEVYPYIDALYHNRAWLKKPPNAIFQKSDAIFTLIQKMRQLNHKLTETGLLTPFRNYYKVFFGRTAGLEHPAESKEEAFAKIRDLMLKKQPSHHTLDAIKGSIQGQIAHNEEAIQLADHKAVVYAAPKPKWSKLHFDGRELLKPARSARPTKLDF
ncbi:MAG: hypothetical protein K0S07_1493, partial [Chlamydiales bacterium]|nr:hypothetical protein [Chlamydiales bacterium]